MTISKLKLFAFVFILVFVLPFYVEAKELPQQDDVSADKVWNINFNTKIDLKTIDGNVKITDSNGKLFETRLSLSSDFKTIIVTPINRYTLDETYTITVSHSIKSLTGSSLSEDTTKKFSVPSSEKSIMTKYLNDKKYNILEYNGKIADYTLDKGMLVLDTLNTPYIEIWSVQSVDPADYFGKEIKFYQFIVNNHILDNLCDKKSTVVCVMMCEGKIIGGYSVPNYDQTVPGGLYSIDGKTLEELTGMTYNHWSDSWEKKYK